MRFRSILLLLLASAIVGCGDTAKKTDPAKDGLSPNQPSKPGEKKTASW